MERLLIRPIVDAPEFTLVIATFAIGLIIRAIIRIHWQDNIFFLPAPTPDRRSRSARYGSTRRISSSSAAPRCWSFCWRCSSGERNSARPCAPRRSTDRGTVDGNRRQLGVGSAWALSAAIGALAGLLLAPVIGINPELGHLIIKALVAAVIGGFGSLGGAVFGGLLLGLLETYAGALFGAAFKEIIPFGHADRVIARAAAGFVGRDAGARVVGDARARTLVIAIVAASGVALPLVGSSYQIYLAELILINIVAAIGLNLLIGNCGQISLCHASLMAIGAYSTALLTTRFAMTYAAGAAGRRHRDHVARRQPRLSGAAIVRTLSRFGDVRLPRSGFDRHRGVPGSHRRRARPQTGEARACRLGLQHRRALLFRARRDSAGHPCRTGAFSIHAMAVPSTRCGKACSWRRRSASRQPHQAVGVFHRRRFCRIGRRPVHCRGRLHRSDRIRHLGVAAANHFHRRRRPWLGCGLGNRRRC